MLYAKMTEFYEALEATTKRLEMTDILVQLLQSTPEDVLDLVIYLTQGKLYPDYMGIELGVSEKLAIKAVELSEPGHAKAMILDTVAHICKARGKLDDAIKYMEMAIQEDPEDEGWKETLEKFKGELQES